MNKLLAAVRRAPKRFGAFAVVIAAVLVPAALFAWGPDRPTFTYANPAPYVTFNSITDNPTHGDERNFVQIKEATAPNSTYGENVTLQAGHEYMVYVFYHNNASSNLNDANSNYKGIARDAFMRVQMPATVKAGDKARITGFVGASNAKPAQVWDEAYGTASGNFALRYVPGSAEVHSNGAVDGKTMPDSLYTTGAPLGFDKLDGNLPGCNKFAGFVTFKFKVDQPNFTIEKQVSNAGENKYSEQVTAQPGGEVEYKIQYKNTGTVQQDNVIIKDQLPAGVTYVDGSTYIAKGSTGGQWSHVDDDGIVERGLNIGSFAPNANAYLKFKAKVTDASKLEKCGLNTLINKATAETENGSKSDTANVVVKKDCEQPPEVKYTCDALTVDKIDRTHFTFHTDYTAENATFKKVEYVIRSGGANPVFRTTDDHYTQTNPGNYTVQAYVTFDVNGEEKTVTSENCKKEFTVTPPNKVEVCNPETGEIIIVDEKDQDKYKPVGDEACQKPEECKPGVPVGDERCKPEECKPGVPMGDERCEEQPEQPCVPSKDNNNCGELPPELPKTGGSNGLAAFLGAGSLIAAIGYYVASRRALG